MDIHCPDCKTVTARRKNGEDTFTDAWSGHKYRCHDHKYDAAPTGGRLEFMYPRPGPVPVPAKQGRWPTPAEQGQARAAMARAEAERPMVEKNNRRKSAVIALQIFGEDALWRPGVTDADRRLMKSILNGEKE